MSSKTWAVCHRLVRHAWNTPRARIAVVVKTLKTGKTGVWPMLLQDIIPEWIENCGGFEITCEPKTDGATRMEYFRIRNAFGGESEFQLHSLTIDETVAQKFKGTVFTCMFFSELTNFGDKTAYSLSVPQLRAPWISYDQHLWIADTNPCEEQGTNHWIYKLFWDDLRRDNFDGMDPEAAEDLRLWQKSTNVIEFAIKDNPFIDPRAFSDLRANFRDDVDGFASYVEGRWVETSRGSFFQDVFSKERHVVGNTSAPDPDEWEVLLPDDSATTLYTGWDMGETNHGVIFAEKTLDTSGKSHFRVIDEIAIVDTPISIEDLSELAMEKMGMWEEQLGRKIQWINWSDASAFDRYRSGANTWDHLIVNKATRGFITLQPAPKFKQSVRMRVQLTRQLLQENRLLVSVKCPMFVSALKGGVRKGTKASEYIRRTQSIHIFDAFSYMAFGEMFWELDDPAIPEFVTDQFKASGVSIS